MAGRSSTASGAYRSRPKKSPVVRRFKKALMYGTMLLLIGMIAVGLKFMAALRTAEGRMDRIQDTIAQLSRKPSLVMSADGKILYQVSSEFRIPVRLADVPKWVQQAIIAAEDKRFYEHSGVDFTGLIRSLTVSAREGRAAQGGSTLTMQLAKLMSDGTQKTIDRKVDDIALAYQMERLMSKDQILELYLNWVYFGEGAHGIAAAAKIYFNKDLKDLTLGEAAMLARCVNQPSKYNPIKNLKRAIQERDIVLGVMRTESMITDDQYNAAIAEKPHINPSPPKTTALRPNGGEYFVDHVLELLKDELPGVDLKDGGYTIETTLDTRIQRRAEDAVTRIVAENAANKVNTGAFILIDREGEILCEVGGVDYRKDSHDAVFHGRMQPGSSFKPFVYAEAMKEGVISGPDDMVSNAPIRKRDPSLPSGWWVPKNDAKWMNAPSYSVRTAVAQSINLPAVHTIEKIGPDKVVDAAHAIFGFRSDLEPYEPLAIGAADVAPVEMAEAYSVFMLRGNRVHPYAISRIIGPDGQVVKDFSPDVTATSLDMDTCDKIDTLLRAVVEHGTATVALSIPDARGKTGTTNSNRDAWFCGYAGGLLGVGWCGNEQTVNGIPSRLPMGKHAFGGTVTVHIWADVMALALKVHPDQPSATPAAAAPAANSAAEADAASKFQQDPDALPMDPDGDTPALDGNPDAVQTDGTKKLTADPHNPITAQDPASRDVTASVTGDPAASEPLATPPSEPTKPAPAPTVKKRTVKREQETQYVSVEICADTGLRATIYCPETVTRQFVKGTEPKRYCNVHRGE